MGDRTVQKVIGAKATEIGFSFDTRDPREAKAREAAALAHLDKTWEAMRQGPKRLTKREAVALSGELYREWMDISGDDPGDAEVWQRFSEVNASARAGEIGAAEFMIGEDTKRRRSMEARFGEWADLLLARHSLVVDEASRQLPIADVAKAMEQFGEELQRHAEGDFRPDPDADRFPSMPAEAVSTGKKERPSHSTLTFDELINARWAEAQATGGSRSTLSAWRTSFQHLATFLGHDDAQQVTRADILAYKDHRLSQGVSVKTVKGSDLSSFKSVFGWAVENDRLPSNPAEGVTIRVGRGDRKDQSRLKGFTDAEVLAILKEASTHEPSRTEKPKTTAARQWVPWILALTGARVGEIVQLRKEDVFEQSGRWVIRITPEAGNVKTGQTRLVPLHRQIVERGFLGFVAGSADGHLFVTPDPSDPHGALKGLTNRLRRIMREVVPDENVQPFHAWHHRFTTLARELGCDDAMVRAVVGHAGRDVHDRYGDHTIAAMARVIDAVPLINLDEANNGRS
ncbi:site-specific integrase [Acuticoccus sp. M5D2P5]|uniref:tyrosine-type recombinase/integrase n=1 Tax=Acuticoccus kalidii TaxID=2910977 RepID=UPI001F385C52|nr:site-specific integrase [Acuticoccus kalidii]MCF3932290.1 site-specific integrase [Acuticoccus kalidii]